MSNKNTHKEIFKSTFLFGFVQIFNVSIKVCLNKVASIFLGTEGIGLIGIFQSIGEILKTFFGFGISESAVRDISKANKNADNYILSEVITTTKSVILCSAFIGFLFTIIFSSYLSYWSFGNTTYTSLFLLLSFVVFFNILSDGNIAILKGTRQLKSLAKSTIFGALAGFIFGVPFYIFLKNKGVVPTLLVVAISVFIFSLYYVQKIKYKKVNISIKDSLIKSRCMIKIGSALMFVSFIGMLCDYLMKIYISNNASLTLVGIYQAGLTIVSGYFIIIITAMSTDYYPRICAIYDDNNKLSLELNKQGKIALILITPLIVAFMFLMPFFIKILYSNDFMPAIQYMQFAIFWTLIMSVSNPISQILIAKQNTKIYITINIFYKLFSLLISILAFNYYSLYGLGIAMIIIGIIHILLMQGIMYFYYQIYIDNKLFMMLVLSILLAASSLFVSGFEVMFVKYILGFLLFIISMLYSIIFLWIMTGLNIFKFIVFKLKLK